MLDKEQVVQSKVSAFQADVKRLEGEIKRVIVGHHDVITGTLIGVLTGGHILLEGVPGLGKTMLVRTLADALSLEFSRIQFTPDLMPADIIGTTVIVEDEAHHKRFDFQRGPIFTNIVLADEINRATPKTQSALLEAMQEKSVTVARTTHALAEPFMVLATQNPLEMEGTYPLPEAQLDRFQLKLKVTFPDREELHQILERTAATSPPHASPVLSGPQLLDMRQLIAQVPIAHAIQDYAVRMLQATHANREDSPEITRRYVRYGASPRGAQAILHSARVRALLDGRLAVSHADVQASVLPALRHRVILNFEGQAEGITTDQVLEEILAKVDYELS